MGVQIEIPDDSKFNKIETKILCFNISRFSSTTQFLICCVMVFLFYLIYGYMQELIFTLDGFQPYGWYLTLVQFGYYTIFGFIEKCLRKIRTRQLVYSNYYLYYFVLILTNVFIEYQLNYTAYLHC